MGVCPTCGRPLTRGKRKRRSIEISTRFHAHVTYVWRELNRRGLTITRDEVYMRALLEACALETADGALPYPYLIIDDVLHPLRTTNRSNREMMQACWGIRCFALNRGILELPEREEDIRALAGGSK